MIATTIINSINVKPRWPRRLFLLCFDAMVSPRKRSIDIV
ncbi:hypothetical protein L665_01735 [Ralstonia solanacearum SD54]|nr:hypothetical protein L665_01735 [Ralstonia solanacearum SD54]